MKVYRTGLSIAYDSNNPDDPYVAPGNAYGDVRGGKILVRDRYYGSAIFTSLETYSILERPEVISDKVFVSWTNPGLPSIWDWMPDGSILFANEYDVWKYTTANVWAYQGSAPSTTQTLSCVRSSANGYSVIAYDTTGTTYNLLQSTGNGGTLANKHFNQIVRYPHVMRGAGNRMMVYPGFGPMASGIHAHGTPNLGTNDWSAMYFSNGLTNEFIRTVFPIGSTTYVLTSYGRLGTVVNDTTITMLGETPLASTGFVTPSGTINFNNKDPVFAFKSDGTMYLGWYGQAGWSEPHLWKINNPTDPNWTYTDMSTLIDTAFYGDQILWDFGWHPFVYQDRMYCTAGLDGKLVFVDLEAPSGEVGFWNSKVNTEAS